MLNGSHRSRLTDGGIVVSGEWDVVFNRADLLDSSYGFDSYLDVTFELDRLRDYAVAYSVAPVHPASISLKDVGGAPIFVAPRDTATGTWAGTLAPGKYRFFAHYEGVGDSGSGEYAVELALNQ